MALPMGPCNSYIFRNFYNFCGHGLSIKISLGLFNINQQANKNKT